MSAPLCECGCKETTGGGRYLPGHDAKHKSLLIREALAGNEEAEATLATKGWTKFLEKRREIEARPPKEVKERRTFGSDQRDPTEAGDLVQLMKAARVILKKSGQYNRGTPYYIIMTAENALDIVVGTHPQLTTQPGPGMWRHFDDKMKIALRRTIERDPRRFEDGGYRDLRDWVQV